MEQLEPTTSLPPTRQNANCPPGSNLIGSGGTTTPTPAAGDTNAHLSASPSVACSSSSSVQTTANSVFSDEHHASSEAVTSAAVNNVVTHSEATGKVVSAHSSLVKAPLVSVHAAHTLGSGQTPSSHALIQNPFPHAYLHMAAHSTFPPNSELIGNGRRMTPSMLPPFISMLPPHTISAANTRKRSSTPTSLTPSSSSASSSACLSPHLSPAAASLSSSAAIGPVRSASPNLAKLSGDVDESASTQTSISTSSTSLSLRGSASSAPPNSAGSGTLRTLPHGQPPLVYPPGGPVALHPAYYQHEAAFYPAAYFSHPTASALPQATDFEYSARALRMAANAAVPAHTSSVGGMSMMLSYPYPYPAIYQSPHPAAYPLYYPYPPHHQHPASTPPYEHSTVQSLPSTMQQKTSAAVQRGNESQMTAVPTAFGSPDESIHPVSTGAVQATNGYSPVQPMASASANSSTASAPRAGVKRRKRPVSSLEEMLYRLSEFSMMEKRLKSKNKACATLGYSKGTINSYIDKVHAALQSGVELSMMGPLTVFDIRRMIHKRSEGKKEQQEKLVYHQQRKKLKSDANSQVKLEEANAAQIKDDEDEQSGDIDAEAEGEADDDDDSTAMDQVQTDCPHSTNANAKELLDSSTCTPAAHVSTPGLPADPVATNAVPSSTQAAVM